MKKLVIIGILFALIVGVSIWEITYSTRLFSELHGYLATIEEFIAEDDEQIDSRRTILLMEKVERRWESAREVMFCFCNHNTLRMLDEKLISLSVMIRINHAEDAKVTVKVAKRLLDAIQNDTHPVPSNLF